MAASGLDQDQEGLGEVMTSEGLVMESGDAPDEHLGKCPPAAMRTERGKHST